MKIIQHYHVGETLQRSVVEHNGVTYRRIARYVDNAGELIATLPPRGVAWEEKQRDGTYKFETNDAFHHNIETQFINALIAANFPAPAQEIAKVGSRYFADAKNDRVYHFPDGKRGTAYFPLTGANTGIGCKEYWSLEEMPKAGASEISFTHARTLVPHVPA